MIVLVLSCIRPSTSAAASQSAAERGHFVYLSEGCSRCHAHDIQRGTADMVNRRKGSDLSGVGARRSALWLKMHLYDPSEVSGPSIMPSYAFLFRGERGNDLVAYLESLRGTTNSDRTAGGTAWRLSPIVIAAANLSSGQQLFNRYCATCHSANGRTRLTWQSEFIESPAMLRAGAMRAGPAALNHLAQIIKFGIPDSDMAGHEHMPDKDIASLVAWLTQKTSAGTISIHDPLIPVPWSLSFVTSPGKHGIAAR